MQPIPTIHLLQEKVYWWHFLHFEQHLKHSYLHFITSWTQSCNLKFTLLWWLAHLQGLPWKAADHPDPPTVNVTKFGWVKKKGQEVMITNSYPASAITEVKQVWAWLVLGWEKTKLLLEGCGQQVLIFDQESIPLPQCSDRDVVFEEMSSFRWAFKPRSVTVVIKDPMALCCKE